MAGEFLTTVLDRFAVSRWEGAPRLESRSGSHVLPVRTADGRSAYLKATPAALGPAAIEAARRELCFYRELAPVAAVRTPALLESVDDERGVAVLLEDADEPRDAPQWTVRMWADLGRALAALHAMPVPTGARWRRPNAMGDLDIEQIGAFWSTSLPEVARLLDRRCVLGEQMRALPPVFVHGDCHTENVTVADGALVFCDWQSAGIGRRSGDLAFLSVRATPAGVSVPPVLLDAYERNSSCDPLLLRRAVIAEELAILVFEWPNYAAFANAVGIARVQRRTRELARQWLRTEALTAEPPGA